MSMVKLSQLISHRFRGFSEIENSVEGLLAALDFGVAQVEFDIRVTACGTPLIYHDEAARDQTGQLRRLCEIMAKDRARLGGAFAYMPTAEQLLEVASRHSNKARLLIDIKDAGFEEMLLALVHQFRLNDRVVWVSWLTETLYNIRALDPKAELTLSHWCQNPNSHIRRLHKVFEAANGVIPPPSRTRVIGERSGWFVDGPLRGDIREMIKNVCVPVDMVSRGLVEDYRRDGIKVSAFSYISRKTLDTAALDLELDDYFIDAKSVFESFA